MRNVAEINSDMINLLLIFIFKDTIISNSVINLSCRFFSSNQIAFTIPSNIIYHFACMMIVISQFDDPLQQYSSIFVLQTRNQQRRCILDKKHLRNMCIIIQPRYSSDVSIRPTTTTGLRSFDYNDTDLQMQPKCHITTIFYSNRTYDKMICK